MSYIDNLWDRDMRNDLDKYINDLYNKYNNFYVEVSKDITRELMENSTIQFLKPVDTKDDLEKIDPSNGDTSFVTEDGIWYRWNGDEWKPVAKTDPSEFISLQHSFEELKISLNDLKERTDTGLSRMVYIVEEGQNENGEYIRYSDGTQVCWAQPFNQAVDIEAGNIFRSESTLWTFPKEFKNGDLIHASATALTTSRWADITGGATYRSVYVRQFSYNRFSDTAPTRTYAFGRWK